MHLKTINNIVFLYTNNTISLTEQTIIVYKRSHHVEEKDEISKRVFTTAPLIFSGVFVWSYNNYTFIFCDFKFFAYSY